MSLENGFEIIDVSIDNVEDVGLFCVKNKKAEGHKAKLEWFRENFEKGLKIKILIDDKGKQHGFIEYLPSEHAWRPINANGYIFIQCIGIFTKNIRNQELGKALIEQAVDHAKYSDKAGVCVMSSDGPWMATKEIFEKNGFAQVDKLDRFELYNFPLKESAKAPEFIDWTENLQNYKGWHLFFSNQCPWHIKSVLELQKVATEKNFVLNVWKLKSPEEAKEAPTGFGTFGLIRDGRILADHYISKTRFLNILKKELE